MRSRSSMISAIAVALASAGYQIGMGSQTQESLMRQIDMVRLQRKFASASGGRAPRPIRPGGTHGSSQRIKVHVGSSGYRPHQGKQECARRVRQMGRGMISADQISVDSGNAYMPY